MPGKQVTVKDIAARLNLHYTTVSKALRDHPDIKPATKKRVLALARELDYHPNSIARGLKRRQSSTIGVIVPSIRNDFFSAAISSIEEVAYNRGFSTLVCQSNESLEREALNTRTMISNRVAGVAVSVAQSTDSGRHLKSLRKQGIPLVFFDRYRRGVRASRVVVDDYAGAVEAVQYLIASGRKRIAHFAGPDTVSVGRDRCKGYMDAMKKNGLPINEKMLIRGGFEEKDGVAAFDRLAAEGRLPDAIFAVNDLVASGAYRSIKDKGLRIPRDIAMVGFGDNAVSSYLDPPLTTVRQSPHELGRICAEILLLQIKRYPEPFTPKVEVVETQLIIREST